MVYYRSEEDFKVVFKNGISNLDEGRFHGELSDTISPGDQVFVIERAYFTGDGRIGPEGIVAKMSWDEAFGYNGILNPQFSRKLAISVWRSWVRTTGPAPAVTRRMPTEFADEVLTTVYPWWKNEQNLEIFPVIGFLNPDEPSYFSNQLWLREEYREELKQLAG